MIAVAEVVVEAAAGRYQIPERPRRLLRTVLQAGHQPNLGAKDTFDGTGRSSLSLLGGLKNQGLAASGP